MGTRQDSYAVVLLFCLVSLTIAKFIDVSECCCGMWHLQLYNLCITIAIATYQNFHPCPEGRKQFLFHVYLEQVLMEFVHCCPGH